MGACNSPEELLALAEEEGCGLSDEELDAIAGGYKYWYSNTPYVT